jgi:threonine dehydratase
MEAWLLDYLQRILTARVYDVAVETPLELAVKLSDRLANRAWLKRDERLYRFEFPERPGALMRFLSSMHPDWNISLFHYRNQGADYGRILVGIQVPPDENADFRAFIETLSYPCEAESENPVYRLFLR